MPLTATPPSAPYGTVLAPTSSSMLYQALVLSLLLQHLSQDCASASFCCHTGDNGDDQAAASRRRTCRGAKRLVPRHNTEARHMHVRRRLLSSKGDEPWRAGDGIGAEVRATNHVDSEPGDSALEQRSDGPVKATALTDSGDKGRRPCDRSQRSRREWRQGEWRRLGDAFKRPAAGEARARSGPPAGVTTAAKHCRWRLPGHSALLRRVAVSLAVRGVGVRSTRRARCRDMDYIVNIRLHSPTLAPLRAQPRCSRPCLATGGAREGGAL